MNSNEYELKLHNAKTQSEREKINDEFLHSQVKINKINKFKNYIKQNHLAIIAIILSLIALFK